MEKSLFKLLAKINRTLLPSLGKLDMNKLSKLDKALIAYKYWVTTRALD